MSTDGPYNGRVVSMVERKNDGRFWSVEDMLRDALEDHSHMFNKGIVLLLDDKNDNFNFHWLQSGMKGSEMVALTELAKQAFAEQLLDARSVK